MLTAAWCAASSVIQCRVFFCVSSHGHPFHLIGRVATRSRASAIGNSFGGSKGVGLAHPPLLARWSP